MGEETVTPFGGVLESQSYYVVFDRESNRPFAFCEQPAEAARLAGARSGARVKEASVTIRYTGRTSGATGADDNFSPWNS